MNSDSRLESTKGGLTEDIYRPATVNSFVTKVGSLVGAKHYGTEVGASYESLFLMKAAERAVVLYEHSYRHNIKKLAVLLILLAVLKFSLAVILVLLHCRLECHF